jgi:hypothetical protein
MAGIIPVLRELQGSSTNPEEQKYYKLLHLILTEPELPTNQASLNTLFRRNAIPQTNGTDYKINSDVLFSLAFDIKSSLEELATKYPDVSQQRNILRVAIEKLTGEGQKPFENRGVKFLQFLSIFLRKQYTPEQIQRILDNSQLYTYLLTFNKDWQTVITKENRRNRNAVFRAYINNQTPFIELLVSLYNQDKERLGLEQAKENLTERIVSQLPVFTTTTPTILNEILRDYIGDEAELTFTVPPYTDALGDSCTRSEAIEYMCAATGKKVLFCPETISTYGPSNADSTNSLPDVCTQLGGRRKTRKTRRRKTRRRKTTTNQ